ncbi:MAG: chemotaxis protein CheD [Lachnospiraceae bacterium]
MSAVVKVGMADLNICHYPDIITTLGLGSCIGIALYDPVKKLGGLAHIMLPDSTQIRNNSNIAKFADTGIEELVRLMVANGASKSRLVAKIAGGACMFAVKDGKAGIGNIGARNAEASKAKLKQLGIRLLAEDTGLNYGRTVELHTDTGEFYIKSVGKPLKII